MHGVDGVGDALAGGDVDGGGTVGAAAAGEEGRFGGEAGVGGDDGVEAEGWGGWGVRDVGWLWVRGGEGGWICLHSLRMYRTYFMFRRVA